MATPDDVFQTLPPNAVERCAASPALGPPFVGVRIAAPTAITTAQRFTLCAGARLPYGAEGFADHASHLYVVAIREDGASRFGKPIRDSAQPLGDEPSEPIPRGTVKVLSFFTTDLFETLDVPREPAVWFVHAFLGPHVSNGVRVEIVAEATA